MTVTKVTIAKPPLVFGGTFAPLWYGVLVVAITVVCVLIWRLYRYKAMVKRAKNIHIVNALKTILKTLDVTDALKLNTAVMKYVTNSAPIVARFMQDSKKFDYDRLVKLSLDLISVSDMENSELMKKTIITDFIDNNKSLVNRLAKLRCDMCGVVGDDKGLNTLKVACDEMNDIQTAWDLKCDSLPPVQQQSPGVQQQSPGTS